MSSNADAWLEVFDAEYSSIKSHIETIKGEIRRARHSLRVEAITGDPQKAAAQAEGFIQWMRGIAETLKESTNGPTPEQTHRRDLQKEPAHD